MNSTIFFFCCFFFANQFSVSLQSSLTAINCVGIVHLNKNAPLLLDDNFRTMIVHTLKVYGKPARTNVNVFVVCASTDSPHFS